MSIFGLKKTCPACEADIRGRDIAVANLGYVFPCPHCSTALRWTAGPGLAVSLALALLSVPAGIHYSADLPVPVFLGALAVLILTCMWLATSSLKPVPAQPARTEN